MMTAVVEMPHPNVAAVVYCDPDKEMFLQMSGAKESNERVYFFLNIIEAQEGDFCLTQGSDGKWGVVQVKRLINPSVPTAIAKVTKPLLAKIEWDQATLNTASRKLKEFTDKTADSRIDDIINSALGPKYHNDEISF